MSKLINNHIIFSYDEPQNLRVAAQVNRYLDTLWAMDKLKYTPRLGVGSYKGDLEPIVMMDYNDFMAHVWRSRYIQGQESFLHLNPRSPRTVSLQGSLMFNHQATKPILLGDFKEVSKSEAIQSEAWTYLDGKCFVCKK